MTYNIKHEGESYTVETGDNGFYEITDEEGYIVGACDMPGSSLVQAILDKIPDQYLSVNRLWLFAIAGEMVLNYKFGLVNSGGSPFAQFKKVFPMAPRGKKDCLLWLEQMLDDNEIRVGDTFYRTVDEIKEGA